jgi:hypothetical protein
MTPESRADLQEIRDLHAAIRGEAIQDERRYCAICRLMDGRAAAWPCKTVRIIQRILDREKS